MYFLVNASPPKLLDVATQTLQVYRSHDKEGTGQLLCNLDPRLRSNDVFSVNAYLLKPSDIATSNFAGALVI